MDNLAIRSQNMYAYSFVSEHNKLFFLLAHLLNIKGEQEGGGRSLGIYCHPQLSVFSPYKGLTRTSPKLSLSLPDAQFHNKGNS